jgi:hypothetical protein
MTLKKMTEGRDPETGRFVSGNNGGPGRQKGSRNKLGEAFLADVYESWQKHGRETLEQMRRDNPAAYVRVVASILPDKLDIGVQYQRIERVIVQVEHKPGADQVLTQADDRDTLAIEYKDLTDKSA